MHTEKLQSVFSIVLGYILLLFLKNIAVHFSIRLCPRVMVWNF